MRILLYLVVGLLRFVALGLASTGKKTRSTRETPIPYYGQGGQNHWHWRQWD